MNGDRSGDYLTIALALLLVIALAGVVYIAVVPDQSGEPFTEFGVLNESGEAAGYPTNLSVSETGTIRVAVVNHEGRTVEYRLVANLDGRSVETYTVTLADGARDERAIAVRPVEPGRKTLRLSLYRGVNGSATEPYRTLRLDITVDAATNATG